MTAAATSVRTPIRERRLYALDAASNDLSDQLEGLFVESLVSPFPGLGCGAQTVYATYPVLKARSRCAACCSEAVREKSNATRET